MSDYVKACPLEKLPPGHAQRVEIDGWPVAVIRADDGEVYALHDVCSHANVPLSEGEVDGSTIECWLHGSRFDLRTGQPTGLPATLPVPVYPTQITDTEDGPTVYVRLEK